MTKLLQLRTELKKTADAVVRELETQQGFKMSREQYYLDEKKGTKNIDKLRVYAKYFGVTLDDVEG